MLNPLGAYGSLESFKKYPPKSGGQYMKESFPEVFPTRPLTWDEIEEVLQYMKKMSDHMWGISTKRHAYM
jgi:hypothetical protein